MQLSKTFINFKLWYLLLHKITKQYLDFIMRKTPKVKGLIGPALLIAIIFVFPSVASLSTSAIAQGPNLGKNNTTAGGNMTGGNTTSSSSALHKPYKCLLIHCV